MSQKLNVANFICKFGEEQVLLDHAEEIVIPAFLSKEVRQIGDDARYFFHDVSVVDLSDNNDVEVAVMGRLIKETIISRDQIYTSGKIIKDKRTLESAPSSFFVLLLSNHKLLYVKENVGSPSLAVFAGTAGFFIKQKYRERLNKIYADAKKNGLKITRGALSEKFPPPVVEIVELSTDAEIRKFVKKFRVINTVEIQLLSTNHENDNAPLFRRLRRVKDDLGADRLTIKNTKAGEVGLNKADVADFVAGQAEEANSLILLKGTDLEGDPMNAVNDHFKVSIPIRILPANVKQAAATAIELFQKQIRSGTITVKRAPVAALRKLNELRAKMDI